VNCTRTSFAGNGDASHCRANCRRHESAAKESLISDRITGPIEKAVPVRGLNMPARPGLVFEESLFSWVGPPHFPKIGGLLPIALSTGSHGRPTRYHRHSGGMNSPHGGFPAGQPLLRDRFVMNSGSTPWGTNRLFRKQICRAADAESVASWLRPSQMLTSLQDRAECRSDLKARSFAFALDQAPFPESCSQSEWRVYQRR
jgi:hypothetical protein